MRVPQFLTDQRVFFETILHPPAYSAQKRAKFLHVPGRQVVKAVLMSGPSGFFLAVLPATRQVDTDLLGTAFGGPVRLATDMEIGQVFRDCERGVVPPFGVLYGLPTIMDESLDSESIMVFEGNTHFEAIRLHCREFERLEKPRRLPFAVVTH